MTPALTTAPLLSVIVLGYNGRRFLAGCLGAVVDQTLSPAHYEAIYADNHSTDGSADFVEERFRDVRVLRFDKNLGFAEGNNRALAAARCRFIVLINQDIILDRRCLAALIDVASARPRHDSTAAWQLNMLMPWHEEFTGSRERLPSHVHYIEAGPWGFVEYRQVSRSQAPREVNVVSGACFMIDREALPRVGYLFDRRFFMYSEDLDLSLRLRAVGYHLGIVPDAVTYHLHDAERGMRGRDLVRAFRATRNRLLAYYKTTEGRAFKRLLPALVIGAPLKVFALGGSRALRIVQAIGMVAVSAGATVAAASVAWRYRKERAALLAMGKGRAGVQA